MRLSGHKRRCSDFSALAVFNKPEGKIMKIKLSNTILSVAGLLLAATFMPTTFAQSAIQNQSTPAPFQPAQPEAQRRGDRFAGLNLTDDQKAQIKQIREDAKAKADAVKGDKSLSDADKSAKLRAIRHDAHAQTRKVLTPEQRKQLKAKMRERRGARQQSSMAM